MGIQERGPRFTLKLRSFLKGTFDSKYRAYEWIHKPWKWIQVEEKSIYKALKG